MNSQNNSADANNFSFSKLFAGSSQGVLIVLVLIIGLSYIINGTIPAELIDFAKWVVGGTSATGVAYMLKSGYENKAKIEKGDSDDEPAHIQEHEYEPTYDQLFSVNPEEHDL